MIDEVHWSGDYETGGYRVVYQPVSDFPTPLQATPKEEILGIKVCIDISFLYVKFCLNFII